MKCLKLLFNQKGLGHEYNIEVFLVDDGCTDGTAEAIREHFPQVNIIHGSGDLYWNRGMHLAWETSVKVKDFDYFLLLNDDTFLFKDAILISLNLNYSRSIVVGTTQSIINQKPSYGGLLLTNKKLISPNGSYQKCDMGNGNFLLVPKIVYNKMGMLDPIFHHALGDYDYFLRGKSLGIDFYVAPNYVGICENHITEFENSVPKWRSKSVPLLTRLKFLYQPQGGCNPSQFFIFQKRHFGLFNGIYHFCLLHIRCIFPDLWEVKSLFSLK